MNKGHVIAFLLGVGAAIVFAPQISKIPGVSRLPSV